MVAPVVSTEGAIAAVASVVAGERLGVGAALLLLFIAVGVVLAATGPTTDLVAADDGPARTARPVLLACAAALSFGASLYATSKASADLPVPWVLLPARLIGVAAIAVPRRCAAPWR